MVTFFPKQIANKGILLYILSLTIVSVLYMKYAIPWYFMLMGMVEVSLFFLLAPKFSRSLLKYTPDKFEKKIFWTAFVLRTLWVVFSFFFYIQQTGQPFEYNVADAYGYHADAEWASSAKWDNVMDYLFYSRNGYSDSGYVFYLTILYKIIGSNIFPARIVKAFISSFMCVLIYRLASRNIGEEPGRMAAVFCVLMPNLYVYCGLHLKETEMLFLEVAFLERTDYAMRQKKIKFWDVIVPLLLCGSLFFFRTALGAVAAMSFFTALLFSTNKVITRVRKFQIAIWAVLAVLIVGGSAIMTEIENLLQKRSSAQEMKRLEQTSRGNLWAKYATGTVMAPMIFVLPFTTMVDTDQYNQLVIHGGNFVRNFMGAFVLIGLFTAIFTKKTWRNLSLIGSFTIFYLLVIAMSGFANSERFLLPGLPGLLIIAAYGVSELTTKSVKFVKVWYFVVVLMQVGWAFFKLGSRGLVG